jgi:ATP-dependent Clp protease adaptor protein ClpS
MKKQAAQVAVADTVETRPESEHQTRPRRQPRYHVILWDDDDHSYDYVIRMMQELFGHDPQRGYEIARSVDKTGRAICLTTTREHAELKQDQVHAYGKDKLVSRCCGSMSCTIEPEC